MDLTLCVGCGILTVDTFTTPAPIRTLGVTCRLCHLVFCLQATWLEIARQGLDTDVEDIVCAQLEEVIGYLRRALREQLVADNVTIG
jgi:hypothetical protein